MQLATPLRLLRWLSHPGCRLSQRALHATVWVIGSKGIEHSLAYLRIIILAHLLAPVDFGLMGIGLVVIAALHTITLPGFQEALVQRKGNVEGHLDTLWTLTILRTLTVGVILALAAPFLATFFKSPDATLVMQALAGAEFLRGFVNPGILYFQKDLEFQKKSINDVAPVIAEAVVAITAAIILHNVWALVFGFLARQVVQVGVSYWTHPYRPRLAIRKEQTRDLFAFGRWVYLTRLVTFASTQSDSLILTKLLGPVTLGFYQMAQRTSIVPLSEIHRSVSAVAFPVYSKVQDDLPKLRHAFLRSAEAITSLTLPLAIIIVFLAREFVEVALGEKWLPAVSVIQILAVSAFFSSLAGAGNILFMGMGKPWLGFQLNLLRAITVAAAVFPLVMMFGLGGAAYAVLLASGVAFSFYLYHSFSILRLRPADFLKALLPALSAAVAIALVAAGAKQLLGPISLPGLVGVAFLVFSTYGVVFLVLWWKFKMGLINSVLEMRQ